MRIYTPITRYGILWISAFLCSSNYTRDISFSQIAWTSGVWTSSFIAGYALESAREKLIDYTSLTNEQEGYHKEHSHVPATTSAKAWIHGFFTACALHVGTFSFIGNHVSWYIGLIGYLFSALQHNEHALAQRDIHRYERDLRQCPKRVTRAERAGSTDITPQARIQTKSWKNATPELKRIIRREKLYSFDRQASALSACVTLGAFGVISYIKQ